MAADFFDLTFTWHDALGRPRPGTGRVWLPERLDGPAPLIHAAGYEQPEAAARAMVADGFIVSTPTCDENPMCRGPNLDLVLFRLVRSLPCVDRTRVLVSGGSAGGYTSLLLAAATFPLAGAVADAPVLNLPYEAAYALENERRVGDDDAARAARPFVTILPPLVRGGEDQYPDAAAQLAHSQVAHAHLITCPVSATFSTADVLVPIEQLGTGLLPPGADVVVAMDELVADPGHRTRLLDVLDPAAVELRPVLRPEGTPQIDWSDPEAVARVQTFPVEPSPDGRQWVITVLDEGPPHSSLLHFRYAYLAEHGPFRQACAARGVGVEQLTEAKLDQLLRRYRGEEWMAPGFTHLDHPEAERADVEAGLRAYCDSSPAHRQRFDELYGRLPAEQRIL